jgi:hypothetical protein
MTDLLLGKGGSKGGGREEGRKEGTRERKGKVRVEEGGRKWQG